MGAGQPGLFATFTTPLRKHLQRPLPQQHKAPDHRRFMLVAVVTSLALLINHYLAINTSLPELLQTLANFSGQSAQPWLRALYQSPWRELLAHLWWLTAIMVGYVLLPALVIRLVFREQLRDYGLGWQHTGTHWRYYALLGGVMALLAVLASFNSTFLHTYPFYSLAGRSLTDLLLWELLYVVQFFAVEFFFRGFLLRSLESRIGIYAIYVSSLVYLTIHLPKPFLECAGSLAFGLILCLLASLSRSIWGGVLVHVCLAVSMDLLSLLQRGQLPTSF